MYLDFPPVFVEDMFAPCELYGSCGPSLLSDVEEAGTQVAGVGQHHLLVGDCVTHVSRPDHQGHTS